jgi:hypothetical protein
MATLRQEYILDYILIPLACFMRVPTFSNEATTMVRDVIGILQCHSVVVDVAPSFYPAAIGVWRSSGRIPKVRPVQLRISGRLVVVLTMVGPLQADHP